MISKNVVVDGVALNNLGKTDPMLFVDTLDGWYGAPAKKTSYSALPFGPGSYYTPAYDDVRTIKLAGTVASADAINGPAAVIRMNRIINGLCRDASVLAQIRVDDAAGSLYTNVQRSGELLMTPVNDYAFTWSMALTAPDPRLLDVNTQSISTTLAQSGAGGVQWNGPAGTTGAQWNGSTGHTGLQWGQPIDNGFVTLDDTQGNAPADITFTIVGPVTKPTVSTSLYRITYNGALGSNDTLTINTGSGSVLLNGVNRRPMLTQAQFFQIPAGRTLAVQYSADDQNNTSYMTATWRTSII